jgi:high-affinity iron transporter
MLAAFIVTLREGLEAFLIIGISLAYLRRANRPDLAKAVYWGVVASLGISLLAGIAFRRAANQALWEGVLAIVAAVMVATLTIHMWRVAKHLKSDIHSRLETYLKRGGKLAFWGVFTFTVFMIAREGMEAAVLLNALLLQVKSVPMFTAAIAGLLVSALVAWTWTRYGQKVPLALFFQVTAVFLMVFVVQLLIYGFHELTEAGVLPYSEPLHWATEPWGPDGRYGKFLSFLLVLLPAGWLAVTALLHSRRPPQAS